MTEAISIIMHPLKKNKIIDVPCESKFEIIMEIVKVYKKVSEHSSNTLQSKYSRFEEYMMNILLFLKGTIINN